MTGTTSSVSAGAPTDPLARSSTVIVVASLAVLVVLTFANPWVFTADDSLF